MGMDVYGKAPAAEVGEYFRRNVWGWHPLWEYVQDEHPDIAGLVEHGHTNDGDGLDADASAELARRLRADVATGRALAYVDRRDARLGALPRVPCNICEGTGQRPDGLCGVEWKKPGCNGCDGLGHRSDFENMYYLSVSDLVEFAEFLEACGGFEVW